MDVPSRAIVIQQRNSRVFFKSNSSSFASPSFSLRVSDKKLPLRIQNRVPSIYSGGPRTKSFLDPKRSTVRGFYDDAHTRYYEPRCCASSKEGKDSVAMLEKSRKKKLKLLKGLTKDLSVFSDLASDLAPAKAKILSETAEILTGQMQQLRAEEDESKRKKKHDKAKMKGDYDAKADYSSSSSSESSDGECPQDAVSASANGHETVVSGSKRRIEVCMGKKCNESGDAAAMFGELNLDTSVKAADAMVVRCKCMGRCGDGPNVRFVDETRREVSLCSGVALGDVSTIVSDHFGDPLPLPAPATALLL